MRLVAPSFQRTTRMAFKGLALAFALQSATRADVLIGNLGSNNDSTTTTVSTPLDAVAVSFTTPGVAYTLTSVQLRLSNYAPSRTSISLAEDDGSDAPGTSLGTLLNPVVGSNPGTYTFTPSGVLALAASTKYWLVVDNTNDEGVSWKGDGGTPSGLATFGSYATTDDGGSSWGGLNTATPSFQINVTTVPETSTWIASLAVAALAGGAYLRRRR